MKLEPCLSLHFNGDAAEALAFYEQVFGAKVAFRLTWGDSPMAGDAPAEWRDKLLHARFNLGDNSLVAGDVLPGMYRAPQGFSITISLDDPEFAERAFQQLAESGTVTVPMQETFWAPRFGSVRDKYGITWDLNCEKPV